jgi:hypothetical protein
MKLMAGMIAAPLVVIRSEPSPILPVVPVPSCAVKPSILFGSVGLLSRMIQNRLTTQSLKSQYLTSPDVTAPACAQHEAAEAQCLGSPLFPLNLDGPKYCIGIRMI